MIKNILGILSIIISAAAGILGAVSLASVIAWPFGIDFYRYVPLTRFVPALSDMGLPQRTVTAAAALLLTYILTKKPYRKAHGDDKEVQP